MSLDVFDPGDLVTFSRTFTAPVGSTPTAVTITCTLRDPEGVTHVVTLGSVVIVSTTASASGNYLIPSDNDLAGMWWARWLATGDIEAADEVAFYVIESQVLAS